MPRKIDWNTQIGRRLQLRDLHVLTTVAKLGSMAKAAAELGVATPTVSEIIANLEHALGVRLFDRSPFGVEPTRFGHALLKRTVIVFDELKQGIKDIEYLADPTMGEVRTACTAAAMTFIPQVIQRFAQQYPRATVYQDDVTVSAAQLSALRQRRYDFTLTRLDRSLTDEGDDLSFETLFDDRVVLTAGIHTPWARRRKIDLAELVEEPWILSGADTWNHTFVTEAFQARGLPVPRASVVTLSTLVRGHLLAHGPYIAPIAQSSLRLHTERSAIKILPVDLPDRTTPIGIISLKNRALNPIAERFIEYIRDFTRLMRKA